ncbi:hypothetical protein BKA61DRAFT_720748 [Leptodontidium sp. MPI-SDFR-AT-0119]|nr:hypothetical protein BKA61DRAFT_720748 [Leptodontidium sp. MPI-SDFR-AT-0119]
MSSLSEVIRCTTSIVDNPRQLDYPLEEWTNSGIRSCLKPCGRGRLAKWHLMVERAYGNEAPQDQRFSEVQGKIDECLKSASRKSHTLRKWTTGRESPGPGVVSYRHLVILAVKDVLEAFGHFCDLRGNPTGIVFVYIKKCYEFMIVLGQLLYPYRDGDTWYSGHGEYLDSGLDNFQLDGGINLRRVPSNPTLAGVIQDESEIPATFLPRWPEPPLVVRTRGPYGPALSKNVYRRPE